MSWGLSFADLAFDTILNFKKVYRNKADIYDLELWHQYEENHPYTFSGMYQFWCQKTLS